ncbi:hypothetical protein GlitD10_0071 [Gloeomargarita lithophora Alchichica-D10]|uniref:Uncharacterized protein n=1 Tax=Gloeomargarita lithophora Alchichica-D10 TaxID=1188229 RepID=A0A1J0A8W2_9CYAN|nr:hypothetical protein [Gloeomargarita lithophora]APB32372.1 hypothetical protein GlitD10_0071 [Gloeomargarita lithophora Alchichica-D10]
MNPDPMATLLAQLQAQQSAAQERGDDAGGVLTLVQRGLWHLAQQEWEPAGQCFQQVATLAGQAQQSQVQTLAQRLHYLLVEEDITAQPVDLEVTLTHLQNSLGQLLANPLGADPGLRLDFLCYQAELCWFREEPQAALAYLDQALALAVQHNWLDRAVQVQLWRQVMLGEEPVAPAEDAYSNLYAQILEQGNMPVAGDRGLQKAILALKKGDHRQVFELAQTSQKKAQKLQDTADQLRYLFGSVLMAFAQEGLGNDRAVIQILQTCQQKLHQKGVIQLAQEVGWLIMGLETRWGLERWRTAKGELG